jgi:hypothetical protein
MEKYIENKEAEIEQIEADIRRFEAQTDEEFKADKHCNAPSRASTIRMFK